MTSSRWLRLLFCGADPMPNGVVVTVGRAIRRRRGGGDWAGIAGWELATGCRKALLSLWRELDDAYEEQ